MAGTVLIAGAAISLVVVLALAGRANDDGVFDAAELAAMRYVAAGPPSPAHASASGPQAEGTAWPLPGRPCPDCGGRRCATWRDRDLPCGLAAPGTLPVYAVGLPLPRDGRHATSTVVARWLAGEWWREPMPIRLRRQLGRMVGATRVPIQLGYPVGRLP